MRQAIKHYESTTVVTLRIVVHAIVDYEKSKLKNRIYEDTKKRFRDFLFEF